MDRRDFIKTIGYAGGAATAFGTLAGGLGASAAAAAHHETTGNGTQARTAMGELLDAIREVETNLITAERGFADPADLAEAERALAHILHTALEFWLEAKPNRPVFKPYVTPDPEAARLQPGLGLLLRADPRRPELPHHGQCRRRDLHLLHDRARSQEGHAARGGSIAAISDEDMEIAHDGSYEITVSRDKPARGNWLPLGDGASQVTTRHHAQPSRARTSRRSRGG
ncbi:MAG: hypothetical protein R3E53_06340 [Myxococcota bacterium]